MNVTGNSPSGAQSAIAAYFTAVPSRTRPPLFFAKSRSIRRVAFSLRSRSSSARSGSDRSESGTRPDSRAFFTHLPNVISWTPILFATSAMVRPESRTRLTAWSLYSWVKCRRVATRVPPLRSAAVYDRVSTRAGTVHLRDVVTALDARQVFIKPHCPWQNGKVERLNRTLQTEWAYRQVFTSNAERAAALAPWIDYYNTRRRHSALGGHPPASRLSPT